MKGLKLFTHSVRMVFGNLKEVIQIGLVPYILATLVAIGLIITSGFSMSELGEGPVFRGDNITVVQLLSIIVVIIVYIVAALWTVVNWHRFVLLNEYPKGMLQPFRGENVFGYLGGGFFLVIVVGLPSIVVLRVLYNTLIGSQIDLLLLIIPIVGILAKLIMFRLSPILPAVAIGNRVTLAEAWNATSKASWPLVLCLLIFGVLNSAGKWLAETVMKMEPISGVLLSVLLSAVFGMIGISLLTTIYGHYVEGRELS